MGDFVSDGSQMREEGEGKLYFVMDGQDAMDLSDFCAYETIHSFNELCQMNRFIFMLNKQ